MNNKSVNIVYHLCKIIIEHTINITYPIIISLVLLPIIHANTEFGLHHPLIGLL